MSERLGNEVPDDYESEYAAPPHTILDRHIEVVTTVLMEDGMIQEFRKRQYEKDEG